MNKNNILEQTQELFEKLEDCQSDEEKLSLRTEIYKLNISIVNREMAKCSQHYNDLISNFYDDLYSAMTEALWTAIIKYKASKNANLYTFATPYIAEARSNIIRSYVTKDTLSAHEYRLYCEMRDMVDSGMSKEEIINSGKFGSTGRVIKFLYPLVVGTVFPMETDVALVSCTQRKDDFAAIDNVDVVKSLKDVVCTNEQYNWLFERAIDGEVASDMLFARTFHVTRRYACQTIARFQKLMRETYLELVGEKKDSVKSVPTTTWNGNRPRKKIVLKTENLPSSETPDMIDINSLGKGGESVKVPVEARLETIDAKLDMSIDLGVKKYIDERVKEKIDKMTVGEIVNYVVESLHNNKTA